MLIVGDVIIRTILDPNQRFQDAMNTYTIGIDTGGTYTDAVLMDCATGTLIASAKRPTTHHNLALSTTEALTALLEQSGVRPDQIHSLVVSTTLATNSVVENKGARVALLVIGYVRHFKLPVKAVIFIKGGHTITGEEEQPLDIEYLAEIVSKLTHEVDAYGVCSAMSIKNPTHELVAEKAISMLDPKPVFCSHRTSTSAGMKERAATAGLHAKLMPIMEEYVNGVAHAMAQLGLSCPMLVVGGNGQTIKAEEATAFAGATVASGPACTAHFGSLHTSSDALVIDVGGTTTDIAMLQDGAPLLAKEGCQIGQWRTHIEAVDMITGGIGGDSHVVVTDNGELTIGPGRVIPLARGIDLPPAAAWLGSGERAKRIVAVSGLDKNDEIERLLSRPGGVSPAEIRGLTGISGIPLERKLEQLARDRKIYEYGFTPTDALHVLGMVDFGAREKAIQGAEILAGKLGVDADNFCRQVLQKTEEQIENLLLDYVINHYWGNSLAGFLSQRNTHPVLGVGFTLRIPLIGIGACAPHLLEGVARRLGTTVTFPEHGEVGNAVGAALLGLTGSGTKQG